MVNAPKQWFPKTEQERQVESWSGEGRGIGQVWTEQNGSMYTRLPDGTPKLLQRSDQLPDAKIREKMLDYRMKLLDVEIPEVSQVTPPGMFQKPQNKVTYRSLSPEEVEGRIEAVFGPLLQEQSQGGTDDTAAQPAVPGDTAAERGTAQVAPADVPLWGELSPEELAELLRRQMTGTPRPARQQEMQLEIPTVKTEAEYRRLPPGSEFIGPSGERRLKPR
jgi:hypothetical protein